MNAVRSPCIGVALALACLVATAHDYKAGAIAIAHPHARATVGGQSTAVAYMGMGFKNDGAVDWLRSATAAVSSSVELHSMSMDGGMMRMRRIDAIELPAGATVMLEPGGLHMMFVGLKAPLRAGESFPLELRFEKAGKVLVQVRVEAITGAAAAVHKH